MATTTTTTATVGGGTTVDNLNVLDGIKSNDLGSLQIITWADVAAALGSTTNATQTQTIQTAFTNGQLSLTFQLVANVYYTIDHTTTGYVIAQTDQYGFQSGQFDVYTNQLVSFATAPTLPPNLQSPTTSLSAFLTNVGSFLGQASAIITADLDGGSGKDVIQGIVGDGSLSTGWIHNIIQGGTGADVLSGGSGSDYFVYNTANDSWFGGQLNSGGSYAQTWDQITNFGQNAVGAGVDKLDFTALVNDTWAAGLITGGQTALAAGKTALSWLGLKAANTTDLGAAGKYAVWYTPDGSGGSFVYADTNGDGKADLKIQLASVSALTVGNFVGVVDPAVVPAETVATLAFSND